MNTQLATAASTTVAPRPLRAGALGILVVLFVAGLVSLAYALNSNALQPDFRLFTVSYLFLMGVSQAGVVFCALTRLVGAQWAKPYYRLAELATLAFLPFAFLGLLLIVYCGKDELFYWLAAAPGEHMSPWLNLGWLVARDLLALLLFYGLSLFYVITALRPDLSANSTQGQPDHSAVEKRLYALSPWVIICFVVCNTLFAWDFAMMLIPHWHSTVFPIFYWFGNLFAGAAALTVVPLLLGRSVEGSALFGPSQLRSLSMLLSCFTLMWLYFFWAQFFVMWFGNLPHETGPLWRQMYGHYAPYYWTMMACCFFAPFAALIFAVFNRSLAALCLIGLAINLGIWICRYLMVIPALSPDHTPFDNWVDISLSLGLLAGFLAAVLALASRLPLFSYWEIARTAERKHP